MAEQMSEVVEVYLPVAVTVNRLTGELDGRPVVDFEGAPWMHVDKEANIWSRADEGHWFRAEDIEETAINLLGKLLGISKIQPKG